MRLLFVNPYIYDFTAYDLWVRPLGLLYLASVVKKFTSCEIYWIDALDRFQPLARTDPHPPTRQSRRRVSQKTNGRGKFHREIVEKPPFFKKVPRNYSRYGIPVRDFKEKLDRLPDIDLVFMTSLMTYWIDGIRFTMDCIKKRFPGARFILGGILPTLIRGEIKRLIPVDDIIPGPGEKKILDYLRKMGTTIREHPELSDINTLPFPAYEYLSNTRILPLLTSRGCPCQCSYCATRQLNPVFLERDPENIIREISELSRRHRPEHFVLFDDALLVNQKHRFKKVFSKIRSVTGARFHTPNGLHAREIKEDTANMLYESGFDTVRLGFESTDPDLLTRSSNKLTVRDMVQAVNNLENAGYRRNEIEVYLLFGIKNQSRKQMEDTLYFIRDLGAIPRLSFYSPVPGTPDFLELQKTGVLSRNLNIYETNKTYFVYQKSDFSHRDIQELKELTNHIVQQNKGITTS